MAPSKDTGNDVCLPGQAALAVRLLKRLAAASDGNLIFSPISIYAALALVAAGARGQTLDELLDVLGAPSLDELVQFVGAASKRTLTDQSGCGGPCVAFASGAWCDASQTLKPTVWDTIVGSLNGTLSAADFRNKPEEACQEINSWVAGVTRNLITTVIDPHTVRRDTVLILANAVYFKGQWQQPFSKESTSDGKFFLLDGRTVKVPFMRSWEDQFIACHDTFKVLKMPYRNFYFPDFNDPKYWEAVTRYNQRMIDELPVFSMCIFLPNARDGLQSLVDRIISENDGFLMLQHYLPKKLAPVHKFRIPKFRLSFSGSVIGVLGKLGLRLPFDQSRADLLDMVEDDGTAEPLFVRDMFHKAILEVDEEGSEAAAATMMEDDLCAMDDDPMKRRKPVNFVAEHPFVFFIMEEKSGTIVFAGQVLDPSVDE